MRLIHAAAALALIAGAALAQQPQMTKPGSNDPALVTAGSYTADPNHTLVTWTLDHMGFSEYTGIFGDVTGTLTLDPKNLNAAKVDMTIPISKITTVNAALTAHLLKPAGEGGKADFFGASPADAHFVSTSVAAKGQSAKITGNLTLNGVTKPVTLDARFYGAGKAPPQMGGKDNVGFHATATLMRSDFGLGYGVPIVGDAVKLDIAAAFQK